MPADSGHSLIERLADRLPYSDGSYRRRLVAGALLLIGVTLSYPEGFAGLAGLSIRDVVQSPGLLALTVLLIFALGSLAEMLGEVILVRMALGLGWGLSYPIRYRPVGLRPWTGSLRFVLACLVAPLLAVAHLIAGIFGVTFFRLHLAPPTLSPEAWRLYEALPDAVRRGLAQPIGDRADLASRHLIERFTSEADRRWARKLVSRPKDVLATTTATVFLLWYFALPGLVGSQQVLSADLWIRDQSQKLLPHAQALDTELKDLARKTTMTIPVDAAAEIVQFVGEMDLVRGETKIGVCLTCAYGKSRSYRSGTEAALGSIYEILDELDSARFRNLSEKGDLAPHIERIDRHVRRMMGETEAIWEELKRRRARSLAIGAVAFTVPLLLYVGFFVVVRAVVINLVEGLVTQKTQEVRPVPGDVLL